MKHFFLILMFGFIIVPFISAQEIMIGTEHGPELILQDQTFITTLNCPDFWWNTDSLYFFPTLKRGGWTYTRSNFPMNFYDDRKYFRNPGDGYSMESFPQILNDPSVQIDLFAPPHHFSDGSKAWRSDRIQKQSVASVQQFTGENAWRLPPLWHDHTRFVSVNNWHTSEGGAVTDVPDDEFEDPGLTHYWITNQISGSFVIGNPDADNDFLLSDNWCRPWDHTFFHMNGKSDRYRLWFLVKMADNAADEDDLLLTLYINTDDSSDAEETFEKHLTAADSLIEDDNWHWIEFHPATALKPTTQIALRWHGTANAGKIKFARFAYQSDVNFNIYGGDNEALSNNGEMREGGSAELAFRNQIEAFRNAGAEERFLGWINPEPQLYGYKSHKDVSEHLRGMNRYGGREFTAQYGVDIKNMDGCLDIFVEETEVPSLYFDQYPIMDGVDNQGNVSWWYWENSIDGEDVYATRSIQTAWNNHMSMMKEAAEAAGDIPLHVGIQSSGVLKWVDGWKFGSYTEPTPRMVKCQGYLAMTVGAKGFFYSYYGPAYTEPDDEESRYARPIEHSRFDYTNGAFISGLLTLCPNVNDDTDTLAADWDDLEPAFGVNGTGWLRPNPKWYAAKEFNEYVHFVEHVYSNLRWFGSECSYDDNTVGYITINSTTPPVEQIPHDPDQNKYVQVGVFSNGCFMLVNRRCATGETRDVSVTLDLDEQWSRTVYVYNQDGSISFLDSGAGDLEFTVQLPPATGRLFVVSDFTLEANIPNLSEVRGNFMIDDPITVTSTGTLRFLPGSSVTFTDNGSLTVYGKLEMLGKDDTNGDSLIVINAINSSVTSPIKLFGTKTDKFEYTKFRHMPQGLKIDKALTDSVFIDHCEFAYNTTEGINMVGGYLVIDSSNVEKNGTDGLYVYNSIALVSYTTFDDNADNGLYAYNASSNTLISHCEFTDNGSSDATPDGGIFFYGCSPVLDHNTVRINDEYGLYGANGAYPVMFDPSVNAANTIGGNASHETCWDVSYPQLYYGHNNFNVEDDTLIYITGVTLSTYNAKGNYWGGSDPYLGSPDPCYSYVGPGTLLYDDYDTAVQTRVHDDGLVDLRSKEGANDGISDGEEEREDNAFHAFVDAVALEEEAPVRAIAAHRALIEDYTETSYAPISIDHLLWLIRQAYEGRVRDNELDMLDNYFANVADTTRFATLAWKAHRASLWALAAQHRYDDAIAGFEAIVQDADCLADSVFAVIDAGTLHLEAQEWVERNDPNRGDAISYGSMHQLCPVDYPTHRKHVDELLSLLNGGDPYATRAIVPQEFFLAQNYPNPFNNMTRIQYGLPLDSKVQIRIYDIMGREVATLVNGEMKAGYYTVPWMSRNNYGTPVSSGVYFCRIQAGNYVKTTKMTLLK